jgi:probable F420-dependent oxidoreductase
VPGSDPPRRPPTWPWLLKGARSVLGAGVLLAPEQKVVLDGDPQRARTVGRPVTATPYLSLVNYTNNLRRLGWGDEDLADGGSDRLIDALLADGDPAQAAVRITEHLDAGADHVALHLLGASGPGLIDGYRRLADVLIDWPVT